MKELTIEKTVYLKTWTKHLKNNCGGANLIMFRPQRY